MSRWLTAANSFCFLFCANRHHLIFVHRQLLGALPKMNLSSSQALEKRNVANDFHTLRCCHLFIFQKDHRWQATMAERKQKKHWSSTDCRISAGQSDAVRLEQQETFPVVPRPGEILASLAFEDHETRCQEGSSRPGHQKKYSAEKCSHHLVNFKSSLEKVEGRETCWGVSEHHSLQQLWLLGLPCGLWKLGGCLNFFAL